MSAAAQIREHYDSLALVYRAFWGDHIHHGLFTAPEETSERAQLNLIDYCVSLVNPAGSRVLDVGCGHGGTAIRLVKMADCEVVGLTISEKQAHMARENACKARVAGFATFLTQDAETFDYPREAFDIVWTMESSEHFEDKSQYFLNVARTLRPAGRLLLTAWTGSMNSVLVRMVASTFLCPALWTPEQYRGAIEAAGMRVIAEEDVTSKVVRTWEVCRERVGIARPAVKLLPPAAREFVEGIEVMLRAYHGGDLRYTIMVAEKPAPPETPAS